LLRRKFNQLNPSFLFRIIMFGYGWVWLGMVGYGWRYGSVGWVWLGMVRYGSMIWLKIAKLLLLCTCPVLYTYIHHNGRRRGQYYSYYMVTDTKPTRPPVHPPLPLVLVLVLSQPPSFHDHTFGTHPLIAVVLHATILHCRHCRHNF
jgi:hypothetical protein